jgi:hypothetical protein
MVNIYTTQPEILKTTMVDNHQTPWSTIAKHHGQQSSKTMVTNHQKPWSKLIKYQGQLINIILGAITGFLMSTKGEKNEQRPLGAVAVVALAL